MYINVAYLQRGKYQPRIDLDEDAFCKSWQRLSSSMAMQPIVIRALSQHCPPRLPEIIAVSVAGVRRKLQV